jgi:hypothetical protein
MVFLMAYSKHGPMLAIHFPKGKQQKTSTGLSLQRYHLVKASNPVLQPRLLRSVHSQEQPQPNFQMLTSSDFPSKHKSSQV